MSKSNVVFVASASADRDALFARATELSNDFAARAAALDEAGLAPLPEIVKLKKAGLLNALQPVEIGGGGLDWVDALQLVRIIARGESSLGQLLGYHYVNSEYISWALNDRTRARALAADTVARNLYWGAAVNPRDPGLVLTRQGNDYVLNGRKSFSTAARISDYINANATLDGKIAGFAVPTDRPGYFAHDDWHNMGQRLSDSGGVEFRDFPVYASDFIGSPAEPDAEGPVLPTFNTPLIQLVFVNFYLGTAEGALAAAIDYVRTTTRPWITSNVDRAADDPYILERVGEFTAALKASVALADSAASAVQNALSRGQAVTAYERGAAAAEAYAAKVHSTHVSLDITARVFELTGARSTAAKFRFDRFWRNVRTHTLHDPVFYKAREVGEFVLNDKVPTVSLYS